MLSFYEYLCYIFWIKTVYLDIVEQIFEPMTYDELIEQINQGNYFEVFEFLNELYKQFPDYLKPLYNGLNGEFISGKIDHRYPGRLKSFVGRIKHLLPQPEPDQTFNQRSNDVEALFLLAFEYHYEKQKYSEALNAYNQAIEIQPNLSQKARYWYNLGVLYDDMGKPDDATQAYKNTLNIDDQYYKAYEGLGWVQYTQEKFAEAIISYRNAIDIEPNNHETWNWLGKAYKNTGDYTKAKAAYRASVSITPDYYNAWHNLGWIYYKEKNYENALEAYQKVLAIDAEIPETLNDLGLIYKNRGEYDKAIDFLKKAVVVKPKYANAWYNLGIVYRNQKDYKSAIGAYEKAREIRRKDEQILLDIGWTYLLDRQLANAKTYFNQILNNQYALMNLGHISFLEAQPENALKFYQQSLVHYPNKQDFFQDLKSDYQYL